MYESPKRFYSLDALRGIAALCVVFFHWQHFFYKGTARDLAYTPDWRPYNNILYPLYDNGWMAVDLFFCLSGFIFYWLYSLKIADRKISAIEFFNLRFSRLYPLHVVTLIFVVSFQQILLHTTGSYFVYRNNDAFHFLLNGFMISSWGIEKGFSFNGPSWSISVEVFLYGLFFLVCRFLGRRPSILFVLIFTGLAIQWKIYDPIGRGISSFFIGTVVYIIYDQIKKLQNAKLVAKLSVLLACLFWVGSILYYTHRTTDNPSLLLRIFLVLYPITILFPVTVLALALSETILEFRPAKTAAIGDISYSSYLLHFPLQLAFFGTCALLKIDQSIFSNPTMLFTFFSSLISFSFVSFKYFEMPSQSFLRTRLLKCKDRSA